MENYLKVWKRFVSIIFIFILVFGCSIPAYATSSVEGKLTGSISEEDLITLTNQERLNNNLPILEQNGLLQVAARLKVKDMIDRGYFSHKTPDGKLPWYWLNKAGYKYEMAGENLAIKFFDSTKAVKAWMKSPKHCQNILNKEYTQIGIAVDEGVYEGKDAIFVVQFFGTPQEVSKISFFKKISNKLRTATFYIL